LLLGNVKGDDDVDDDRERPAAAAAAAAAAGALVAEALEVVAATAFGVLSAIKANCNEDGVVMVGVLGRVVGVLGRGKTEEEELRGGGVDIMVVGVFGRGGMLVVGVLGRGASDKRLLRELRMLLLLLLSSMLGEGVGEGRYKGGAKEERPGGKGLRRPAREDEEDMGGIIIMLLLRLPPLVVGVEDRDMLLLLKEELYDESNVMLAVSRVS
jgi:hypothetical protein